MKARDLIDWAYKTHSCVPAFNFYGLDTLIPALDTAEKKEKPVMVSFGESYLPHMSFRAAAALFQALTDQRKVSAVLHLDHCKSLDHLKQAVDAGFQSVMIDGSALPFEDNVAVSAEAAACAHQAGIVIEGELGGMNDESGAQGELVFTDPEKAAEFVRRTGVDTLAVSVGNAHGFYTGTPHLQMDRIERIQRACGIPLVLHGCSGIPLEQLKQAAGHGVIKMNVNTEVASAGAESLRRQIAESEGKRIRLDRLLLPMRQDIAQAMDSYFSLI